MSDEHPIFDRYSLANESMARNFAPRTNLNTSLDLDKTTDPRLIPDFATIEIDEAKKLDISAKFDIGGNPQTVRIRLDHMVFFGIPPRQQATIRTTLALLSRRQDPWEKVKKFT